MSDSFLFMFFSTIETFSLYFLIMSLFRFKWQQHAWQALTVILGINLQSYLLRNELDMANFSSLVLIIIFIIFFAAVVKMPILISILATITGFIAFALIQTAIMLTVFGSLSSVQDNVQNGYLLQLCTAIVTIVSFRLLYIRGKGFTFDIEKLRFKLDDMALTIIIVSFLIGISILLCNKEIYLHILIFVPTLSFLLFYSKRKEIEEDY